MSEIPKKNEPFYNTTKVTQKEKEEQKRGKWEPEEDVLLTKYVHLYQFKNWKKVAEKIKGRTPIQCLHRWTKILQPGLVKGPWTEEENQKLREWVKIQGPTKWTLCSETIPGRSGKQCREHWNNSLNPQLIKGNWTAQEDLFIMHFYKKYKGSWKKISPYFYKRTENAIKNRFFSQLRKIATQHIYSTEKKFASKIGLEVLVGFLDEALLNFKENFKINKNFKSIKEVDDYLTRVEEAYEELVNKQNLLKHDLFDIQNNINNIDDNKDHSDEIKKLEAQIFSKNSNENLDLINYDNGIKRVVVKNNANFDNNNNNNVKNECEVLYINLLE